MRRLTGTLLALITLGFFILLGGWDAAPVGLAAQDATPTLTPLPDRYEGLSIDELAARSYGAGELEIVDELDATATFTRYLVRYPSDDLMIYGFMNVPVGTGPFPVVIALHGYINPAIYSTIDYTTRYADALAQAGFLVLHPNLRGYRPSDDGPNLFRVGMAIDVLNLAELVRQTGGLPGALEKANPTAIGLWGHSMGGGISLRAITVDPQIDAAVLYGAMSGNEANNFAKIREWSEGARGNDELGTPDDILIAIGPLYHLSHIKAAVSIHHGASDELVPFEWSADLCARLNNLNKRVECFSYPNQPHTFEGEGDQLFIQRTIDFFERYLKDGDALP